MKLDWLLALLMTSSVFKVITLLFNYQTFQTWVAELLADPAKERKMIFQVTVAGIGLIALGLLVY